MNLARCGWISKTLAVGVLALTGAILLPAGSAHARQTKGPELTPPEPSPPKNSASNLGAIGAAIVLGGMIFGVNLIPSKRGHQD